MKLDMDKKIELSEILDGDVYFDKLAKKIYSTAACIYQIEPAGVIYPRHSRDVVKIVRWAKKHNVPITARGTGSALAGQAIGEGIILDFSRYMNRILEVNIDECYVRVQPGVVYGKLNNLLAEEGKIFPPDPASGDYCTIGGMIGNNSSGPRSVKYGATKDYVLELSLVLYTGEEVKVTSAFDELPSALKETGKSIDILFKEKKDLIEKYFPPLLKNSSGYNLKDAAAKDGPDFIKLFTGSEGTLALVTEAKLKIVDIPEYKSTALLFFDSLEKLGKTVNLTLPLGPSVIEMMDKGLIDLVRDYKPDTGKIFPLHIEGALLIEFEGADEEEPAVSVEKLYSAVKDFVIDMKIATDVSEQEKLWQARRGATPLINSRADGERRPVTFIEDVAVLPEKFPEYIMKLRKILTDHGLDVIIYGHAGHGNVHVRPLLDLKNLSDIKLMKKVAEEVYTMALKLGGTLSGEHGDGILRAPYLRDLYGPLYDVMKEVKNIFDPLNLFNPGKIIASNMVRIDENLKFGADFRWESEKYPLNEEEYLQSLVKCHGCGMCRTFCPVYKAVGKEAATPRAKVNWLREFARGKITAEESFESELAGELLSTCFNCHSCAVECPTGVDASLIARGAKYVFQNYLDFKLSNIIFENAGLMAKGASLLSPISNLFMGNSIIRLFSENVAGISGKRELPLFKKEVIKSFFSSSNTRKVVYFAGCYERFYEPELAQAVAEVLSINGFNVEIPETVCCEMPKISSGSWDRAGMNMVRNIRKLYSFAKRGTEIVTACPSCNLALKSDYPYIMKNQMALALSRKVINIEEFLLNLYDRGELNLDFGTLNKTFIYHAPCHLRAEGRGNVPLKLLQLIPGLTLKGKTETCCGIAGSFGMKSENFKVSAKIAEETFKDVKDIERDFSVTSCGTCKIQMKQFVGGEVYHPLILLRDSYRLGK